jgi:hypothetical protein
MSVSAAFPLVRARHESLNRAALRDVFVDQQADVVVAGRPIDGEWDARLARVLYTRNRNTAADVGLKVARKLGGDFDPDVMDAWLTLNAEFSAAAINDATRKALADADDKDAVFGGLLSTGAAMYAASMVTTSANFGATDAARKSGGRQKTWISSGSPNSRHSGMNGESVPIGEKFSNGMDWPGDFEGGADEVANCQCSVSFDA